MIYVYIYKSICCCLRRLSFCSNWTWVVEEILAYGNRLRSMHCREFPYFKLCRHAYLVRTNQCTVCPRSRDSFYIVTYYIKWVTTSWTDGMYGLWSRLF